MLNNEKDRLNIFTENGRELLKSFQELTSVSLMALTLFVECRNQKIEGQIAVGSAIRNRHLFWKKSYSEIILQHNNAGIFQFTGWADKGAWLWKVYKGTALLGTYELEILRQLFWIAEGIVGRRIRSNIERADHYYAPKWMKLGLAPRWAKDMKKICRIGDHIFLESDRVK